MGKDLYNKPIGEVGLKRILIAIAVIVAAILIFVFINNQIPEDVQSAISLFIPFVVILWLFIMPKKDRAKVEEIQNTIKQTTIGKYLTLIIFAVLVTIGVIITIIEMH